MHNFPMFAETTIRQIHNLLEGTVPPNDSSQNDSSPRQQFTENTIIRKHTPKA